MFFIWSMLEVKLWRYAFRICREFFSLCFQLKHDYQVQSVGWEWRGSQLCVSLWTIWFWFLCVNQVQVYIYKWMEWWNGQFLRETRLIWCKFDWRPFTDQTNILPIHSIGSCVGEVYWSRQAARDTQYFIKKLDYFIDTVRRQFTYIERIVYAHWKRQAAITSTSLI